jgi:Tfp pilus assembly protein PilF/TolB-like protein
MRTEDPIAPEALLAELDRICESPAFRHSLRQQQFLRHLVECKLADRRAELREIVLGIDFFGRPAGTYDPKSDAVVRVEAGRLRQRLDRYYHGEGTDAPFEILLDKGSYVPVFRVRAPAAVRIGAQPSIAVLPIPASDSDDSVAVERASALTEELMRTLSRLPQARVLRPESAIAADVAGRPADARERLKVQWIVRGGWDNGDPQCLTLEILDSARSATAALRRIEIPATDPIVLHDRVRSEILHAFVPLFAAAGAQVSGADTRPVATTRDLRAFDRYQRARFLLKQRNPTQLRNAIDHLEAAVAADPLFSSAWAELAFAYERRRHLVFDVSGRDPEPAKRAARRAIELDPDAGAAHATLAGLAYTADFDWPEADRLFARALVVAPRDVGVRSAYAAFLMFSARFEESLREYDVIQALDPLDSALRCNTGTLYFYWRRYDRAETVLAQALEMSPHDVYARLILADTYAQSGRPDKSLAASCELIEIAPDYANAHVYRARALAMLGRDEDALEAMREAGARFDAGAISEYEEAMVHIASGDTNAALNCLEAYAARKANGAHCMPLDPTFASLHRDPRWAPMLARVGLPRFPLS